MGTLIQDAAEVATIAGQIDTAIGNKGVTIATGEGGLRNAVTNIGKISTGIPTAGNGLPLGCPRIDLVTPANDRDEVYMVVDLRGIESSPFFYYFYTSGGDCEIEEITITNDGTVAETGNKTTCKSFAPITLVGNRFASVRFRPNGTGVSLTSTSTTSRPDVIYMNVCAIYNSSIAPLDTSFLSGFSTNMSLVWLRNDKCQSQRVQKFYSLLKFENHAHLLVGNYFTEENYSISCLSISGTLTTGQYAFRQAHNLRYLDLSGLDMSNPEATSQMFEDDPVLSTIVFPTGTKAIRMSFSLSQVPTLLHDCLVQIIGSLYDLSSAGLSTQTLTLGSTNLAKLSSAEIAVATDKGWTVA